MCMFMLMEVIMKDTIIEKWDEILNSVKEDLALSEPSFRTWLLNIAVFDVKEDTLIISVNDSKIGESSKLYIKNKFGVPLQVAIEEITGVMFNLEFATSGDLKKYQNQNPVSPSKDTSLLINKKKENSTDNRYTFDNFVVGSNNNLAYAASLAVAESPAEVYNPLFLYGGVGLGKTHLMRSIQHYIVENNPDMKVCYVTSEVFTNELIDSIRNNKDAAAPTEFRNRYRNIDVLLIDDIQFIIGKASTQEEFFHTFNSLYESKKQIIISSDKPPKDFETLEDRLRTRFESGLTVDIQQPDYETRVAILKKKEELDGLTIPDDVINYIATNIKSSIRELEGALTQIVARSRLIKSEITVELAQEALKNIISPNSRQEITVDLIIDTVAGHFNISVSDIASSKKSRNIAYPRQICMYLCRTFTEVSLKEIGTKLGKRDHSTVKHGVEKIEKDLLKDSQLNNTIDILIKKINPQ